MRVSIYNTPVELCKTAGRDAAEAIRKAIESNGAANIIFATGTSQFETLNQLISEKNIDWSKVVMFHLDEYIGLSKNHPASFVKYLEERFLAHVPKLKAAYLINGEADPLEECRRLGDLIREQAGIVCDYSILKYDGRQISSDEIADRIRKEAM